MLNCKTKKFPMGDDVCWAYVVGFCPYEEFEVPGITKKCPKTHMASTKSEYHNSNKIHYYEYDVLNFFKELVRDLDRKIMENTLSLKEVGHSKNIIKALEHTENIIESKSLSSQDCENIYQLLRIHGRLIIELERNKDDKKYTVCEICSTFKDQEECKHVFCPKYMKLRSLKSSLERKLNIKP